MRGTLTIVGRNLRRLRAARGVAASELARRAGLARATLTELESGRSNPTLETLETLARELGTSVSELLSGTDEELIVHVGAAEGARLVNGPIDARLLQRCNVAGALIEQWHALVAATEAPFRAPAHPYGVVESLYLVSGRLEAGPSDHSICLTRAEALAFPADQEHTYQAHAKPASVIITMMYPAASRGVISRGLPIAPESHRLLAVPLGTLRTRAPTPTDPQAGETEGRPA